MTRFILLLICAAFVSPFIPNNPLTTRSPRRSSIGTARCDHNHNRNHNKSPTRSSDFFPCLKTTANNDDNADLAISSGEPSEEAVKLKQDLLAALKELRTLQERDGDFSDVDWGVKGGELSEAGRVPRQVDYNVISKDVGQAAQRVLDICQELEKVSPTDIPTQFLGDKQNGDRAPLNGAWKLLFSNAADAVFSKDSKRGAARAQNIVNAEKSRITNVIDFENDKDGKEPTLKQLNVIIKAKAVNNKRVELNFQYAKVVLTKFFFFPLFGKKLALYIPVPATFFTAVLEFFRRIGQVFGRQTGEKRTTKGYFDVLYLDKQLRVHKTGQGNIFVQAKDDWEEAKPLIR